MTFSKLLFLVEQRNLLLHEAHKEFIKKLMKKKSKKKGDDKPCEN